jgi:DNA-binding NtrC family response regulator
MPCMSDAGSPAADTPKSGKDAVLLIDDERPLLEVYSAALTPHFDVTIATSVEEADALLRAKRFKVVVSDHLMPGGNGMSFLTRIRDQFPGMQRVLVSAYMEPEMSPQLDDEAALFRYLSKPVSLGELVKVVQDAARSHDQAASRAG